MSNIGSFKQFIDAESRTQNKKPYNYFVEWYAGIRAESKDAKVYMFKGGDGEIDLVLFQRSTIVLAQFKYYKASQHDLRAFEGTVEKWLDDKKFQIWLTNDVTNKEARGVFKKVREEAKRGRANLFWEFVSLSPFNTKWSEKLSAQAASAPLKMRAEMVSASHLAFLYDLERIGAKYADEVSFQIDPNRLEVRHPQPKDFLTYLFAIRLPSLISGLNKHGDIDSLLARNVRLEIPGSDVNAGITATVEKDPHKFFFGNNGIHIVATEATFRGDKVILEQPAIINGGQTVKSLLASNPHHRDGQVLLRVTIIPRDYQASDEGRKFVGDIIFMSNNNNKMEPWNLRSNDPVQIAIAKHFHRHKIFYERKDYQWKHSKDSGENKDIAVNIHSADFASARACCDDGINPAGLKEMGVTPLFLRNSSKIKRKAYYDRIFGRLEENLDEALSMARLYLIVDKWCKDVSKIPEAFSSFPRAGSNFVFGLIWRALEDGNFQHPYSLIPKFQKDRINQRQIGKVIHEIVRGLFDQFRSELMAGTQQNDIFRGRDYWQKAMKRFLTKDWKRKIRAAAQASME